MFGGDNMAVIKYPLLIPVGDGKFFKQVKIAELEYETADFTLHPSIAPFANEDIAKYLAMFYENKVIMDKSAEDWYLAPAVLHETICCIGKYRDYAGIPEDAPKAEICRMTEEFVLNQIRSPGQRKLYAKMRLKMFLFLTTKLQAHNADEFSSVISMLSKFVNAE